MRPTPYIGADFQCEACGARQTTVTETRMAGRAELIRRRRKCLACGERFTTYESAHHPAIDADRVEKALARIAAIIAELGISPARDTPQADAAVDPVAAS